MCSCHSWERHWSHPFCVGWGGGETQRESESLRERERERDELCCLPCVAVTAGRGTGHTLFVSAGVVGRPRERVRDRERERQRGGEGVWGGRERERVCGGVRER